MSFENIKSIAKRVIELFGSGGRNAAADTASVDLMSDAIAEWRGMYADNAPWIDGKVHSLGLCAAIASEIARLATVDMKVRISADIDGGDYARAEFLSVQFNRVMPALRRQAEYGVALGGIVLKPFVRGGGVYVDFVHADSFIPLSTDGGGSITGGVFLDSADVGGKSYVRMESHMPSEGGYRIANAAYEISGSSLGRSVPLSTVPEWASLEEAVELENVREPMFAYFKYPLANNVDTESPLGISAFARAVGLIEQADRQYSRMLWEMESGERALYVSDTAFRRDNSGNIALPDKRLYRTLASQEDLFEDFTPALREKSIIDALDVILTKIEDVCGLARGTFSRAQSNVRTATELRAMRQRSYATVLDTQCALEAALRKCLRVMDIWCDIYNLAPAGGYTASFEFDDSVMVDRGAEFEERMAMVAAGVMDKSEMRQWYFGEKAEEVKVEHIQNGEE